MHITHIHKLLSDLIHLSRPRFWVYLFGPYIIGYTSGIYKLGDYFTTTFFLYSFYFLIPANILLYGINDLHDVETDIHNPRKTSNKESISSKSKRQLYLRSVKLTVLITVFMLLVEQNHTVSILLFIFMLLSIIYSAPPLRLKSKPFFDSLSNVLYIFPAIIGFYQQNQSFPPFLFIFAASSWAIAMHLFSAIPDIKSDEKAKIATTAVVLGKNNALTTSMVLWILASITLIYLTGFTILGIISLFYPLITFLSLFFSDKFLTLLYWNFSKINFLVGITAYLYILTVVL